MSAVRRGVKGFGFDTRVWDHSITLPITRGLNVVAGDVVEVSPPFDPSGVMGLNGAQMIFEIYCLMAEAIVAGIDRSTISR